MVKLNLGGSNEMSIKLMSHGSLNKVTTVFTHRAATLHNDCSEHNEQFIEVCYRTLAGCQLPTGRRNLVTTVHFYYCNSLCHLSELHL